MTDARAFRGYRFPAEVILWAVRWYLQFPISYRDLERMLADRGVAVDPTTLYRWVQRFAPEPEEPPGAPAPFTADDLLAPAAGSPIMSGRVWGKPGHMVPATPAFPARPRAVS
jgi:hypothetical protein